MKQTQTIVDVANIVRHFLQNEAKTLEISRGKMLKDEDFDRIMPTYLKVG